MKVKPVPTEMLKMKKLLHGIRAACFQTFSKDPARAKHSICFSAKLNILTKQTLVQAVEDRMEIGMVPNGCDGNGRKFENVTRINALYADFDDRSVTKEELLKLPVPPDAIVETSNGNFHAYWLVKDCSVDRFKPIQKALAKLYGADESVCDPNRAMRLPGTINWKREKPFLVKIVHFDATAKPIAVDQFIKEMNLAVATKKKDTTRESVLVAPSAIAIDANLRSQIELALENLHADDRNTWYRVGMAIHQFNSSNTGYDLWTGWARKSAKFDEQDQRTTWGGFKPNGGINIATLFWMAAQAKTGESIFDEMTVTKLFVESVKDRLRYNRVSKDWLHFTGVVWGIDSQAPLRLAKRFVEDMSEDGNGRTEKSWQRYRSSAGLKSIASHAELADELAIDAKQFDTAYNLLAVQNGVINLETGIFREAKADDFLRRHANVAFDETVRCPEWTKFVRSVACDDRELYEFIRRALGYTLFGDAKLQIFFLVVGSGGNGKGVLMRTVQKILHGYAQSVAPNLLTSAYSGNANGPTPALANLAGARMVICTELPSGRRLDDAFIKQYAGGDEITARSTYSDMFSFKPEGKLWLSTNEIPEIPVSDEAMWRRMKPVPFNAKFRGASVDENLEKKFVDEYPGILNWLLKGAKQYAATELGTCQAVEELVARMRKESDSVHAWMAEYCIEDGETAIQSSVAYDSYQAFTRKTRRKALSPATFRASLDSKGFAHKKKKQGNFYLGFHLQA